MLYVDIPSLADLKALMSHRGDICVSIYLRTTPVTQENAGDRIELKNLAKEAVRQLEVANADKRRVAALVEQLDDLVDDDEFWRLQARSLAVLATPDLALRGVTEAPLRDPALWWPLAARAQPRTRHAFANGLSQITRLACVAELRPA